MSPTDNMEMTAPTLPRKWERVAEGRFQLEHDGFTFDARDFGVLDLDDEWRLECSSPAGHTDTFTVSSFDQAKRYAQKWYAGMQA